MIKEIKYVSSDWGRRISAIDGMRWEITSAIANGVKYWRFKVWRDMILPYFCTPSENR
jgi:hypothetical protein